MKPFDQLSFLWYWGPYLGSHQMLWAVEVAAKLAHATNTHSSLSPVSSLSRSHQLQHHNLWPASLGSALPSIAQVAFLEATGGPTVCKMQFSFHSILPGL